MMSFIKLSGPPILKAIKALEKVAIDTPEVCIMDTLIAHSDPSFFDFSDVDGTRSYFRSLDPQITIERCGSILSTSGEMLGDYDFFFEWFTKPTIEQINTLIEKIDETLAPLGCRYQITTK